jgi:hypothetical protein
MLHRQRISRLMAEHSFGTFDVLRSSIRACLTMLGVLLSLLLLHDIAHAEGIVVGGTGAEYTFAQQMTFTVTARSDVDIRSAVVVFRARNGPEQRGLGVFTPGKAIQAVFVLQLVGGVLPPFSERWLRIVYTSGRTRAMRPMLARRWT